jgi:hypothetical protein
MRRMFALSFAELIQLDLGSSFRHAHIRAIITIAAVLTLKPHVFSFTLLFSHYMLSRLTSFPEAINR